MAQKRKDAFDPEQVARDLFDDLSYTAAVRDLDAHADCMSKKLVVYGIPNVGSIDYSGWFSRRRNELKTPLLYSLTFREVTIADATESEIKGRVHEVLKSMDSAIIMLEKEFTLARETERWRVRSERILNAQWRE